MVLYVAVFAALAFEFHAAMRTNKADLGQIDQAVWNSSRGRLLEQTDNGFVSTRLTDHVEPLLGLISPVLWLWNDVRALLLLQAVAVALGAWPLYHMALRRLDRALAPAERRLVWKQEPMRALTRPLAFALAAAWLQAPQLQSALLTEFHAAPLAVPLILWALWAVEARRWKQFAAAALLVALTKEEMALLAALLGLWAIWQGWRGRVGSESLRPALITGASVALFGLVWFGVATFVIVPRFALPLYGVAESGYFARYGALGDSPLDIVRAILTQPGLVWSILMEPARLRYLWGLVAPFALLALLGPELLLLSLPVLLANVLSAYPAQYYGEFHYSAPVVPYVAGAAALGLGRLWAFLARRTAGGSPSFQHMPAAGAGTMAAAAFLRNPGTALRPLLAVALVLWMAGWATGSYLLHGRAPGGGRYDPHTVSEHYRLLDTFIAQIPPDAPLTATAAVHPHVSHRRYVYQFPLGLDAPVPATWALLDVTTNSDMAPGDLKSRVDEMLATGWGVVDAADGFLLLALGAGRAQIPEAFYSFVRTGNTPGVAALDWARWRQTQLTLGFVAAADGGPAPDFAVLSPAGETLYTLGDAAPPGLLWLPAEQWRAGDSLRLTTLPLFLPRSSAALVDGTVASVFRRTDDGTLAQVQGAALAQPDYAQALAPLVGTRLTSSEAEFVTADGGALRLLAWVEDIPARPGGTVDLWMQWQGDAWPAGTVPFVHLRRNGETVAQQDGPPRLFVAQDAEAFLPGQGYVSDWRSLTLPAGLLPGGTVELVVGLYNPATGERLSLAAGGTEFTAAGLPVRPFLPDQACALNPAVCASQTK